MCGGCLVCFQGLLRSIGGQPMGSSEPLGSREGGRPETCPESAGHGSWRNIDATCIVCGVVRCNSGKLVGRRCEHESSIRVQKQLQKSSPGSPGSAGEPFWNFVGAFLELFFNFLGAGTLAGNFF